ncbi:integration host factor subunit alpha [Methylocystis suflitae]|uniref:integration host factor subunit alpha n=1 Tax=Methylocystis suflitae TaxID=2951405 RepID=UPI002E23B346
MKNGNGRTSTREALREAVYASCSGRLSRAEAREILEMFFEEIFEALERGEPVQLKSFGGFHVRSKRARPGRNPKTGVEATIAARKVLRFRPSPVLIARINGATIAGDGRARASLFACRSPSASIGRELRDGGDGRNS